MPQQDYTLEQQAKWRREWETRLRQITKATATHDHEEWTDRELDRIMDDEVTGRGHTIALTKELGRTWGAITHMRYDIKTFWENELKQLDDAYSGPIVVCDDLKEEDKKNYDEALRKAVHKLVCSSIRKTEHEVGSEDHKFEVMGIAAMLGLME